MTRQDIAQIVTDQIIAALEAGVAPWVRPWNAGGPRANTMPANAATGHQYRGINVMLLWMAASAAGYRSDLWITAKQAAERGGTVRAGERSCTVVYWFAAKQQQADDQDESGEGRARPRMLLRTFQVYNLDQVDGINDKKLRLKPIVLDTTVPPPLVDESARMPAVDAFVTATGATIEHGGTGASYSPQQDKIRMPAFGTFRTAADYYCTILHELTHWTGHKSRDDRFKAMASRFGSDAYAAEELVAEMGAAMLCAELGVQGQLQHAEYIGHWLKVLRGDKHAVFTAAGKAQKALDWLVMAPAGDAHADDEEDGNQEAA